MKMRVVPLLDWQKRFGTEKTCAKVFIKVLLPQGFQCPARGSNRSCFTTSRQLHQCSECRWKAFWQVRPRGRRQKTCACGN